MLPRVPYDRFVRISWFDYGPLNGRNRRVALLRGRLPRPVDADLVLRWKGSASETTMTAQNSVPTRQRTPWNKGRLIGQKRTEQTRSAIEDWLPGLAGGRGQRLFPSRFWKQPHLSTRQYARIVHRWVERAGLDSSAYNTHSMRRTKPAQIYKTGNLRAVQLLLGHTKLERTVRYLGIEVDDVLSISEQDEL